MNYLPIYNTIKYYYEDRFDASNEWLYQKIIHQIYAHNQKWTKIQPFPDSNYETVFNTLHLYALEYGQDIDFIYRLMETYHYSFFHTILWCISDICNVQYEKTEQFLMQIYCNSPYIYKIMKVDHTYRIESMLGMIEFQRATDYLTQFHNPVLNHLAITKNFIDFCHDSTFLITNNIDDSVACTTLCKQAFVGTHYHSVTLHANDSIDFHYNCVIPTHQYQALTNAKYVQMISHQDLEKKTNPFISYGSPLLYSSLHT